jgi:hypothetical protein
VVRHRGRRVAYGGVALIGCAALAAGQIGAFGTPTAGASPAAIAPGNVYADAAVLGVIPQDSGLTLTTAAGQANAAYSETEAQATSGTVNLGGLGVLLAESSLCGLPSYSASEQPQLLKADSEQGASNRTLSGNVGGAGTEQVIVSPNPETATAVTKPVTQTISGLLSVTGSATSTVRYVANTEQEADASVTEDLSLASGLVQFTGMNWSATQHSGASNASSTHFSFGQVTLGGAGSPIFLPSTDSMASVVKAVNQVLGPFGLTMVQPSQTVDPANGSISIGPLELHFSGSPAEDQLLAPQMPTLDALQVALDNQSASGSDCSNYKELIGNINYPSTSVLDIGLAAAQGSGAVDIAFGGATAGTQAAPDVSSPFGGAGGSPASATSAVGSAPIAPAPSVAGVPDAGVGTSNIALGPPAGATPATGDSAASRPLTAVDASAVTCITTSPAKSPGCWRGLAPLAAVAVVLLGSGLLAADIRRGRKAADRHAPPPRIEV